MVSRIGTWTEPQLAPLAKGDARLLVLTPSGPHFGQAPFSALASDPIARPVLDAAFQLLNAVLSVTDQKPPTASKYGTGLPARPTTPTPAGVVSRRGIQFECLFVMRFGRVL